MSCCSFEGIYLSFCLTVSRLSEELWLQRNSKKKDSVRGANDKNVHWTGLKNPGLLSVVYISGERFQATKPWVYVLRTRMQSQTNPQSCCRRSSYFRIKGRKDRARESLFETSIRVKIDHNTVPHGCSVWCSLLAEDGQWASVCLGGFWNGFSDRRVLNNGERRPCELKPTEKLNARIALSAQEIWFWCRRKS